MSNMSYIILVSVYLFYASTVAKEPEAFYLINICHQRRGSKCLGAYIRQLWVLLAWHCAQEAENELAYVIGNSPSLNCTLGLGRKINILVFQSEHFADSDRELVLLRIYREMKPITGVKKIDLDVEDVEAGTICNYFLYDDQDDRLKAIEVEIVTPSTCEEEFRDGHFENDIMLCGRLENDPPRLNGESSPIVCKEKLVGYTVGRSLNNILQILTVKSRKDWIDVVTNLESPRSCGRKIQINCLFLMLTFLICIDFRCEYSISDYVPSIFSTNQLYLFNRRDREI